MTKAAVKEANKRFTDTDVLARAASAIQHPMVTFTPLHPAPGIK